MTLPITAVSAAPVHRTTPRTRRTGNSLPQGDATVTELARPFAVSLPAISRQLRVLERAGLLTRQKQGRLRHCHLEAGPMREAAAWLERYRRYWEGQSSPPGMSTGRAGTAPWTGWPN